jgi:hypothetical protein
MRKVDVVVLDGQDVVVLTPLSVEAKEWCKKHLPQDGPRLGAGYVVEQRYAFDILHAIRRRGFPGAGGGMNGAPHGATIERRRRRVP